MNDRSKIAMLIGLAALALVIFKFGPNVSILGGMLPALGGFWFWVIVAVFAWKVFGGGCCGRSCAEKPDG